MTYEIIQGDCLQVLKTMESESVQMCVTSPPYFGLRDYGVDGQIGLEETPQLFVAKMVEVFEEVRRVLKKDGTLWLNLGDSYAGSGRGLNADGTHSAETHPAKQSTNRGSLDVGRMVNEKSFSKNLIEKGAIGNAWVKPPAGLKQKDLIGIPWRVAFALQDAGWWLRQDIIWSKPNPMPESVTDRCTKAHEYIFLLTKSAKYYYDSDAVREKAAYDGRKDTLMKGSAKYAVSVMPGMAEHSMAARGHERWKLDDDGVQVRNKRSVWTVTTQPYSEAHFATFPPKLIEPCILAGSKVGDTVLDPFNGAGTSGLVSLRHKRNYIGIELNPEYIDIANKRLSEVQVNLF